MPERERSRDDRGSMAILTVLIGVALTAAVLAAMIPWVGALGEQQRARTAADAAALAGVTGGRPGSARLAAANGATLVTWRLVGDDVIVTVELGDHRATARATDGP